MATTTIHREDVKAQLRKRYGSLAAFSEARGLLAQQVRDLLRGKSNAAKAAVATELGVDPDQLVITSDSLPICGTHSNAASKAHRLNAVSK